MLPGFSFPNLNRTSGGLMIIMFAHDVRGMFSRFLQFSEEYSFPHAVPPFSCQLAFDGFVHDATVADCRWVFLKNHFSETTL
jgi:hypothetical protein